MAVGGTVRNQRNQIAQVLEVTTDSLLDESEEPSDQVLKQAFLRKFSGLAPADQEKINQMIDMWGKKDGACCASSSPKTMAVTQASVFLRTSSATS